LSGPKDFSGFPQPLISPVESKFRQFDSGPGCPPIFITIITYPAGGLFRREDFSGFSQPLTLPDKPEKRVLQQRCPPQVPS